MRYTIHKQFAKDVQKFSNASLDREIFSFIEDLKQAESLYKLSNVKKLTGYREYYRYRIGDYRIGMRLLSDGSLSLERFLHRRDVYKRFP